MAGIFITVVLKLWHEKFNCVGRLDEFAWFGYQVRDTAGVVELVDALDSKSSG